MSARSTAAAGDRLLLSCFFVPSFLQFIRERGGDPTPLVEEFALPLGDAAVEQRIPLSRFRLLFERAAQTLDDPFLGVHMAAWMKRGTFGVLEFSARTTSTVREAFSRLVRYVSLISEHVDMSFEERAGAGAFTFGIPGQPECAGRHPNEFFIAAVVHHGTQLLGQPFVPEQCWFAHPRPADLSELVHILKTDRLTFECGFNGLSVPASTLDLPLVTSDPALLSVLDDQAMRMLADRPPPSSFVGEVQATIRRRLQASGEAPTLAAVASELRIGGRTMQRRLADGGSSFARALDGAREELARAYVCDRKLTLTEVAFLLGYTELSPFTRAFKRWTGETPTAFRSRRAPPR